MALGQPVPLARDAPILVLEVEEQPLDLGVHDLGGSEEAGVGRFPVFTGADLELRFPARMCGGAKHLRDLELASVAERRLTSGVAPQDDVHPERIPDGAQRLELNAPVTKLDTAHGVDGHARSMGHIHPFPRPKRASMGQLAADRFGLLARSTVLGSTTWHGPIMAGSAYHAVTAGFAR